MNQSPLALATVSDSGRAPAKRVANAADAQKLVSALLSAGEGRSLFNFQVKGMIDGFPPIDPAKLRENAQSYRVNVNWLEGKARRSAALVPYYDLFSGAKYYAEVESDVSNGDEANRIEWSRVCSEEFHETLREYKGFDFNMQMMLCDFVTFGRGFLMFRDRRDWRFHCIPQHRVFVPDGSECFSDDLEVIVVLEKVRVHRLWNNIKDKELARSIGWNPDAVAEAIDAATPEQRGTNNRQSNWEDLEQRIKDKDVSEGMTSATVPMAHIYVREFGGRITHLIVDLNQRGTEDKPQGFLYQKQNRYGEFAQCLSTFFLETEDGSWNGARGLGNDLFSSIQAKNGLKNSAMDMCRLRTGLMLQAKTAGALQDTALIQLGVFNIIPPGYEVQQATVLGDVESPMKMDRSLDIMLDSNTGTYRQRSSKEGGNPPTAEQVRLDYTHSAVLSNSAVNRFYNCLDPHYREVYRRMSDPNQPGDDEGSRMAVAFQKRCRDRGVPELAIVNVRSVRAYRNAGNGSVFMRQQAVSATMQLVPMLPEAGRSAWLEDAVAILANETMARRWLPKPMMPGNAEDHAAYAGLENIVMKNGVAPERTKTQNDAIHLAVHVKAMDSAAGTVQQTQGESGPEVLQFLHTVGPHAAVHLQALGGDPARADMVKEFTKHLKELEKLAGDLQKHIEQQAKQQQQAAQAQQRAGAIQNGSDPETMIHAAQAQADAKVKDFKAQHAAQMKEMKTRHDMQMKEATTQQGLAISDAEAASRIEIAKREAAMTTHE